MSHSSLLEHIPIVNKYRFIFKAWFYVPIHRLKTSNESNMVKNISRCGVFQGLAINLLTCNLALDGLEHFLLKNLSFRYQFYDKEINCICQQFGQKKVNKCKIFSDWSKVGVRVYRYLDALLILGKASQEHFIGIYKRLVLFLKDRGLNLKEKETSIGVFLPGAKFEFLGFQFQFANSKINRGKCIFYSFLKPLMVLKGLHAARYRDSLFITICPKSYKLIMLKFKSLFTRNRVGLSVEILIKNYNEWLTGIVTYFGVTRSTRIQLMKFDNLAYLKFKELLLRKFSSKPKVRTFVRKKYFTSNYLIKNGDTIQLKVQDIIPYEGGAFCII
jgi:hypothetical protein